MFTYFSCILFPVLNSEMSENSLWLYKVTVETPVKSQGRDFEDYHPKLGFPL